MGEPSTSLHISRRYWAGKSSLMGLLAELPDDPRFRHTMYLGPHNDEKGAGNYSGQPLGHVNEGATPLREIAELVPELAESDTGAALYWGDESVLLVVPPFPVRAQPLSGGVDTTQLLGVMTGEPLVAVMLLRLGRYAVGLFRGEKLVSSAAGTRFVKGRHRAGGSSQRRFQRSRERQARELFDKACGAAGEVLSPWEKQVEHLLMGGERHTLLGLTRRCALLRHLEPITLRRRLDVDRPSRKALQKAVYDVWKSRVVLFTRGEG